MLAVRPSTQLEQKKLDQGADPTRAIGDNRTENDKQKLEDRRQLDLEDRKKQIARKDAADIIAKKDIKIRLNTIKDMKERSQQEDSDRIAAAPLATSNLKNVEAFDETSDETGGRKKIPKTEMKVTGQTSKLIQIAKRQEDMTNTAVQTKVEEDQKSRLEAEANLSEAMTKAAQEKERLVVMALLATIAKKESDEKARQASIREQRERNIAFAELADKDAFEREKKTVLEKEQQSSEGSQQEEDARLAVISKKEADERAEAQAEAAQAEAARQENARRLAIDKADTIERARQSVIAVQREEDARLKYVAKRGAIENDRVAKLSTVKLIAIANKEAEDKVRQLAIVKQQEEDQARAIAAAKKEAETARQLAIDRQLEEEARVIAVAKEEAEESARQVAIAKQQEEDARLAVIAKKEADERAKAQAEAARQFVLMLREEQASRAVAEKKEAEDMRRQLEEFRLIAVAKKEADEKSKQVIIAKQREEEARRLALDKADTIERARQSVIAVQREEDARLKYVAKRGAIENDRVAYLSTVKLIAIANKEAEDKVRQLAIVKQQEEDQARAIAAAKKEAEVLFQKNFETGGQLAKMKGEEKSSEVIMSKQWGLEGRLFVTAVEREVEERARIAYIAKLREKEITIVASAKIEVEELARQTAIAKLFEIEAKLAAIVKKETNEKARQRVPTRQGEEEEIRLAAVTQKVIAKKAQADIQASAPLFLVKEQLGTDKVSAAGNKEAEEKARQLANAKQREEEQVRATAFARKLAEEEDVRRMVLEQQREEEAKVLVTATKEAEEKDETRQRAIVKEQKEEIRLAATTKKEAEIKVKKVPVNSHQGEKTSKVMNAAASNDIEEKTMPTSRGVGVKQREDEPRLTAYVKMKAAERVKATLVGKEEVARLAAIKMSETAEKSKKALISRQQYLENEVNIATLSREEKGITNARMAEVEDRLLTAIKLTLKASEDENEVRTAAGVLASWWTPNDAVKKRKEMIESLKMTKK